MAETGRNRWRNTAGGLLSRGSSLSARYLLVSLLAAILPLAATVLLYDRFAAELVLRLAGQHVQGNLAAAASKLSDFLRTKAFQLESLADLCHAAPHA